MALKIDHSRYQKKPEPYIKCPNCHSDIHESDLRECAGCHKKGCAFCFTYDADPKHHGYFCDDCWYGQQDK